MTLNAHENTVLVAPRPVRLAAPTPYSHFRSPVHRPRPHTPASSVRLVSTPADAFDRLKLGEDPADGDSKYPDSCDRDSVSPRASPRSNLPSEALEEFFSILNSSTLIFPPAPTSPILRATNTNASHSFFSYRRTPSSSISPSLPSEGLGLTLVDPADDLRKDGEPVAYPFKLLASNALASPVSRMHTRNPFQRHPSYDSAVIFRPPSASPSPSPSPMATALSPAAIPLPLPTPDEVMESEMVS
ncbi:hypothetical protein SCP_0407270 [Sparassis crispa]|uniref:Uncharacterized protein n=1 Tax=Sparassis crispa TaxID=139825 RepID=A0A401GJK5_9APHY|nr:hypothetical protein SCP_0407270 [Sparassis crispa]GBE82343.1 hypothetical protein SCP_0407270 [Sparassis crispa]